MADEIVKVVVYVPKTHADVMRKVLGEAGAGRLGNYKFSSFSVTGTGRFVPLPAANPAIGERGKLEEVVEERIETVCYKKDIQKIINAVKAVHPYEEMVIDFYSLIT